jgi:PAS domain S-box-containing protein
MILEHLPDAIFILDSKGVIQYVNKSTLDMLQTNFETLKGRLIDDLFVKNGSSKEENDSIEKQINKGNIQNLDTQLIFKGITVPVYASFSVVENDKGENNFILVSAKDAAFQKALEKELKHQQILTISRDRIRALGELSVGLVHTISQPLTSLEMRLDLMRKDSKKRKGKLTETAFKELERLISQINNNIQVIRLFANQTEDESIGMVNIAQSIRNAHKLVEYELLKRKINFSIELSDDLPFIVGNALLLEQVFVNLIINSRDSLERTESFIRIKSKIINKKWIEIYVIDNGKGIPKGQENQLFDPFFTTKDTSDNPGLGLTISHEIVSSMGGDIFLNSKWEESETCFVVRIPIEQENERDQLANLIELLHTDKEKIR